jgi:hypothetical protein
MEEQETQELVLEPAGDEPDAAAAESTPYLNTWLLVLFAVILAGVAASNLWLRWRAEREQS